MDVIVLSTIEIESSVDGLIQYMSQVILKIGEINNIKGIIETLQQEMKMKDEKMAQFQKEKQYLQERVSKMKTRLKVKVTL
jgi:hypothetical protein